MRLAFDIETNAFDKDRVGCPVDLVHCIVTEDVDTGEVTPVGNGRGTTSGFWLRYAEAMAEDPTTTWIGHNVLSFDIPVLESLYGVKFDRTKVLDTQVLAQLLYPKEVLKKRDHAFRKRNPDFPGKLIGWQSLEAWGWRLGVHKDQKPSDWSVFTPEMLEYCQQDVEVTVKLFKFLEERIGEEAWECTPKSS